MRLTGSRIVREWGFEQSISADIDVFQSTTVIGSLTTVLVLSIRSISAVALSNKSSMSFMFASSRLRIDGVPRSDYCASASEKWLVPIR